METLTATRGISVLLYNIIHVFTVANANTDGSCSTERVVFTDTNNYCLVKISSTDPRGKDHRLLHTEDIHRIRTIGILQESFTPRNLELSACTLQKF